MQLPHGRNVRGSSRSNRGGAGGRGEEAEGTEGAEVAAAAPGTLYVCGTPIGNLEDITLRALNVLKSADLIAAEDTRHTKKLLTHFGISKPTVSYHEHNKNVNGPRILGSILAGKNVALVTDAGMPSVSDPGSAIIRLCVETGVKVTPVPGPSAVTTAVAVAGMRSEQFVFVGFLPRKKAELKTLLHEFERSPRALVAYEAPHRLSDTLSVMAEVLAGRQICVAREITKVHEEFYRGTVASARDEFVSREIRGEVTLVLDGASPEEQAGATEPEQPVDIAKMLSAKISGGSTLKDAVKAVTSETGLNRNTVYNVALSLRQVQEEPKQ